MMRGIERSTVRSEVCLSRCWRRRHWDWWQQRFWCSLWLLVLRGEEACRGGFAFEGEVAVLVSALDGAAFEGSVDGEQDRQVMVGVVTQPVRGAGGCVESVSYTHLRAHETVLELVCRLML